MKRQLTADEAALWQKVIASVKPLAPAKKAPAPILPPSGAKVAPPVKAVPAPAKAPKLKPEPPKPKPRAIPPPPPPRSAASANTLDGSWDRRLSRGLVAPESTVDLHGHTLSSAYDRLDRGLDMAVQRGDRVLLLITGKPPRRESERPHARGAIRAAVGDWLASSRHADRIAAVRNANPRHGGNGALYIVLRRAKPMAPRIF